MTGERNGVWPERPAQILLASIPVERSRYFDGKFMDAQDFALDPDYLLAHHRLHNRMYHGWGVDRGLQVEEHPDPGCRTSWVVIRPGLAVDPLGRELVLKKELAVEVSGAPGTRLWLLGLQYHQEKVDCEPRLYDPNGSPRREWGRVEESPRARVIPDLSDLTRPVAVEDDDGAPMVPLALLRRPSSGGDLEIDMRGRPVLLLHPTRIRGFNWPHGGRIPAHGPAGHGAPRRRLVIEFRRPLWRADPRPEDDTEGEGPEVEGAQIEGGETEGADIGPGERQGEGDGWGVNRYTFTAAVGRPQGRRIPLRGHVYARGRKAVFELSHRSRHLLRPGRSVFITLRCDFVLDERGHRVAAVHPAVPSNNPVPPGGVFESWFHIGPGPRHPADIEDPVEPPDRNEPNFESDPGL